MLRRACSFSGPGQPYHGLARRAGDVYQLPNGDHRSQVEAGWTGVVRLVPERLEDPLRWKRPRRIFCNSMSDLFHENLSDDTIDQVFAVMAVSHRHIYQVLTKRADRMYDYITTPGRHEAWSKHINGMSSHISGVSEEWWPQFAGHIHLGISVENQAALDERWLHLMATPAGVRFFSAEPLLGPLDFTHVFADAACKAGRFWVIGGCESGPGARPAEDAWFHSLAAQCREAGVPYFQKQMMVNGKLCTDVTSFPAGLQIQEFPK